MPESSWPSWRFTLCAPTTLLLAGVTSSALCWTPWTDMPLGHSIRVSEAIFVCFASCEFKVVANVPLNPLNKRVLSTHTIQYKFVLVSNPIGHCPHEVVGVTTTFDFAQCCVLKHTKWRANMEYANRLRLKRFSFRNRNWASFNWKCLYVCKLINSCLKLFFIGTKFGAMLDQLTDRCGTMGLLVTLSYFYPSYMFLFQLSMAIDVSCHWLYMQSYVVNLIFIMIYILDIFDVNLLPGRLCRARHRTSSSIRTRIGSCGCTTKRTYSPLCVAATSFFTQLCICWTSPTDRHVS